MKGVIAFTFGIVGFCFLVALSFMVPVLIPQPPLGPIVFLLVIAIAFGFLNVLLISLFRMLSHLHETVLFPDDPRQFPPRGRAMFLAGYIGLVATLVATASVGLLLASIRFRIGWREQQLLGVAAWLAGWAFVGCLLGGVAMMLNDIYQKAFFRGSVDPRDDEPTEPLDIALRNRRRP